MFEQSNPGNDLLEKKLAELESLGSRSLPSINAFLQEHNLFMTKEDYKVLKKLMIKNKKWKIRPTHDYEIVRRGKKK